ncbi:probable aspartic proteinase GIP2 [Mangifera indica]|uniref:probable aspartic proteinase GIP2 n=1 Tax=Mangifera indica TaxID=29780 RepID=UPI001CFBB20A|nr:probable aspartic proteinase GIP2 [Mangifera indica]
MKSPVAPFEVCNDTRKLSYTKIGPQVPHINLVLHDQNVKWRISRTNSMVEAQTGVTCLAFVDGGLSLRASIIIGGHQLLDNLLEFDLAKSRLGSSLLLQRTNCSNFNFTTASIAT